MSRVVAVTRLAEDDLGAHIVYLANEAEVETAIRFDTAVFDSFEMLIETPFAGVERPYSNRLLSGLRMWFVHGFERYLIFYRVEDRRILIVRVLHSSRDIAGIFSDGYLEYDRANNDP